MGVTHRSGNRQSTGSRSSSARGRNRITNRGIRRRRSERHVSLCLRWYLSTTPQARRSQTDCCLLSHETLRYGTLRVVPKHIPAPGVIPYEVNVPFWSDYSVKDRYLTYPHSTSVKFSAKGEWEFPVGTVFIKTFWMHILHSAGGARRCAANRKVS